MGKLVTYLPSQSEDSAPPDHSLTTSTSLLEVAREIYTSYSQNHPRPQKPWGVAVDRASHRGQLIFKGKPVLLPDEDFVPFSDLAESEAPGSEEHSLAQS